MRLKSQRKITIHMQYNQKNCSVLKRKLRTLFSTIKRSHVTLSNTVSLLPWYLWRENQPNSVALLHIIRSSNDISHLSAQWIQHKLLDFIWSILQSVLSQKAGACQFQHCAPALQSLHHLTHHYRTCAITRSQSHITQWGGKANFWVLFLLIPTVCSFQLVILYSKHWHNSNIFYIYLKIII